jgi:hypothetical protein
MRCRARLKKMAFSVLSISKYKDFRHSTPLRRVSEFCLVIKNFRQAFAQNLEEKIRVQGKRKCFKIMTAANLVRKESTTGRDDIRHGADS